MSLLKKLAGETAIYGGATILSHLLNFIIITPYLTRIFRGERDEYGIHGLMYAYAGLLMVLLTYGMETAFFRFGRKEEDRERAFSTASISLLSSTVFLGALMFLFASEIAGLLTQPSDSKYIIYFALILGFDVLCAIPFARLRMENRPRRFGMLKVVNVAVNAVLILFFLEILPLMGKENGLFPGVYLPNHELHYVFIANLLASLVTIIMLLPYWRKVNWQFDRALWLKMMKYALPLVVVGLSGMINQLADRFLIKSLLPGTLEENLDQLGVYNACIKIAVLMNLFTQAFKYAAEPFFFSHADRTDARSLYAQVGQAFTLIGAVAFLGILLYLDYFQLLIGSDFREGLGIVPITLMAYLFLGIYYNFSTWYKLTDQTHIGAYISVGGAVITLVVNILLIPRIGYAGSAWASLACFGFIMAAGYVIGQRYYPIPYPIGRMALYIALAVGIYLLSEATKVEDQILRTVINTGWLVFYLLLVYGMERKGLLQRRAAH
ncbi:MAG: oligosaccharide flippase family protein [Saprospiraceae bacterium]|nr:oligosaccharide flippase family protein [Saprospiraceae bacterium]MDZ4705692.1 oligosaccharide flippase family protein [Saprospiraceae bacterium]